MHPCGSTGWETAGADVRKSQKNSLLFQEQSQSETSYKSQQKLYSTLFLLISTWRLLFQLTRCLHKASSPLTLTQGLSHNGHVFVLSAGSRISVRLLHLLTVTFIEMTNWALIICLVQNLEYKALDCEELDYQSLEISCLLSYCTIYKITKWVTHETDWEKVI